MKRDRFLVFVISLLVLAFTVSFLNISAINVDPTNTQDPLGIGLTPDKIPTNPQDLTDAGSSYLQKRWMNFIANNSVFAPANKWALQNPSFFVALFGQAYSLSFNFMFILAVWLFFIFFSSDFYKSWGLKKYGLSFFTGIATSILFAQIGFLAWLVKSLGAVITKSDNLTLRIIIGIIIFFLFVALKMFSHEIYLSSVAAKKRARINKIEKTEKETKKREEIVEKEVKNVEEYVKKKKKGKDDLTDEEEEEIDKEADDILEGIDESTADDQ